MILLSHVNFSNLVFVLLNEIQFFGNCKNKNDYVYRVKTMRKTMINSVHIYVENLLSTFETMHDYYIHVNARFKLFFFLLH